MADSTSTKTKKAKAKPKAKTSGSRKAKSDPDKAKAFDATVEGAKPKAKKTKKSGGLKAFRDPRLPPVGTVLESDAIGEEGKVIRIEVCDGFFKPRSKKPDGSSFEKAEYRSPSQVMHEVLGYWANGWDWFGLGRFKDGKLVHARGEQKAGS